jgi:peptidoglycan/LPS O-acetylase OafA/YrhL
MAVLAVLASHAFPRAHGGFLGVDVFFVLSGYLITSLLIAERARTGRIDFVGFYRRRVARLAPAYLLMLVVALPIMLGPLRDGVLIPVPAAVAITAVYGANWAAVVNIDTLGPIQHTWSLSIEEQFYLLWPISFLALSRGRRSMFRWLAVAITAVVLLRAVGRLATNGIWPYVATFTHCDGLLAGAVLAIWLGRRTTTDADRRLARPVAWGGVVVLAGLMEWLSVQSTATYTVGLTVAVVATVGIVWHLVIGPAGLMMRLLTLRPLVGIGRISYGLYLYHMPIFQLVQSWHLGYVPTMTLEFGSSTAVAIASWFCLEQPVQHWVARRWRRPSPEPGTPAPAVVDSMPSEAPRAHPVAGPRVRLSSDG